MVWRKSFSSGKDYRLIGWLSHGKLLASYYYLGVIVERLSYIYTARL
jgi:hypothetical protein